MTDLDTVQQSSELAIVRAKHAMDDAVRQYTSARQVYPEESGQLEAARGQLHSSVIALHRRMWAHTIDSDCWINMRDVEFWDDEVIWQGRHPVTERGVVIKGLRDLDDWVEKKYTQETELGGPKHSGKKQTNEVNMRLPAGASLAAANILSKLFNEYGWDAKQERKTQTYGFLETGDGEGEA